MNTEQLTTIESKIERFTNILAQKPGDELTVLALAEASFRRGLKLEALTAYQAVTKEKPVAEAHLAVAEIYSQQSMVNEAYGELGRLFEIDPENVEARLLACSLEEKAPIPEAILEILNVPTSDEAFEEARLRLKIQLTIHNRELQERTRNVTLEPGVVIHEYYVEEAKKKLLDVQDQLRRMRDLEARNEELRRTPPSPPRPDAVGPLDEESAQVEEPIPTVDQVAEPDAIPAVGDPAVATEDPQIEIESAEQVVLQQADADSTEASAMQSAAEISAEAHQPQPDFSVEPDTDTQTEIGLQQSGPAQVPQEQPQLTPQQPTDTTAQAEAQVWTPDAESPAQASAEEFQVSAQEPEQIAPQEYAFQQGIEPVQTGGEPLQPDVSLQHPVEQPAQPEQLQAVEESDVSFQQFPEPAHQSTDEPAQPNISLQQPAAEAAQPQTPLQHPVAEPAQPELSLQPAPEEPAQPELSLQPAPEEPAQPELSLQPALEEPAQPGLSLQPAPEQPAQPELSLQPAPEEPAQPELSLQHPPEEPAQPELSIQPTPEEPAQPELLLQHPSEEPAQPELSLQSTPEELAQPETLPSQPPVAEAPQPQLSLQHQSVEMPQSELSFQHQALDMETVTDEVEPSLMLQNQPADDGPGLTLQREPSQSVEPVSVEPLVPTLTPELPPEPQDNFSSQEIDAPQTAARDLAIAPPGPDLPEVEPETTDSNFSIEPPEPDLPEPDESLPLAPETRVVEPSTPEPQIAQPIEEPEPQIIQTASSADSGAERQAFYESKAEELGKLTGALARTRGVTSIFLVGRDGKIIDSVVKDDITEQRVGELVRESFEFLLAYAKSPNYWVLECTGGIFVMQTLDERHVLIAIGQAGANFGALRYTMDKTKAKFGAILDSAPQ